MNTRTFATFFIAFSLISIVAYRQVILVSAVQCDTQTDPNCGSDGGGGGGGGGTSQAIVSIVITGTTPSNINWDMGPGSYAGTGNSSVTISNPDPSGVSYTLSNLVYSACSSYAVTNTDGGGSSLMVFPGDTKTFTVSYNGCPPPQGSLPTADLKVNSSDGPILIAPNPGGPSTSVTMTWNSTNSTGCTLSGDLNNGGASSGGTASASIQNNSGVRTETLVCSDGQGHSATDAVTFAVSSSTPSVDIRLVNRSPIFFQGPISAIESPPGSACAYSGSPAPNPEWCVTDSGPAISGDWTYLHSGAYDLVGGFDFIFGAAEHPELFTSCTISGPGSSFTFDPNNYPYPGGFASHVQAGQGSTLDVGSSEYQIAMQANQFGPGYTNAGDFSDNSPLETFTQTCLSPFFPPTTDKVVLNIQSGGDTPPIGAGDPGTPGGNGSSPSVTLNASPTSVMTGSSTVLTWTTTNSPTSCSASASPANAQWTGSKNISGGTQTITGMTASTTFTLLCSNANGPGSASRTVTVTSGGGVPAVTLSANPTQVSQGYYTTLTWTTTNSPTTCTASAAPANTWWSGSESVSGGSMVINRVQGDVNNNATFNLKCTNASGNNTATAVVVTNNMGNGPSATVTANPTSVTAGGSTVLTWSSANADTCFTSESPSGSDQWTSYTLPSPPTGGSVTVSPVNVKTTYDMNCRNSYGGVTGQATVTVTNPPVMSGTLLPANSTCTIAVNASSCTQVLTWTTTNPVGTSAVTSLTGTPNPVNGNNGTQTFTAPYNASGVNFFLYNNSVQLAQSVVATACSSGSSWDGAKCATAPTHVVALDYSLSPDRSSPAVLDGATLTANTNYYIFTNITPNSDVTSVLFKLDLGSGTDCSNGTADPCSHNEGSAPYDFSGTDASNNALPFKFSTTGSHTLASPVTYTSSPSDNPSATFTVVAGALPDLTADNPTPATATAGTPLTFSSLIHNIGSASTGASFSNFFQISTLANGGGTVTDLGATLMSTLAANGSNTASSPTYTFPSSGTYYVRACADKSSSGDTGTITESDETNNCSGTWVAVTVAPSGPSFSYSLSNSGNLNVTKGSGNVQVQETITDSLTAGVTQPVTVSVSNLPSGVSAVISNNPCSPNCSNVITLTVTPSASAATYPLTVTGSPLGNTTQFNLTVNNSSTLTATLTPSAPTAYIGNQVVWSCVASGGTPPYSYRWVGTDFPGGASTASVNITYQTVGAKTATCTVDDSGSPTEQEVSSAQSTVQVSVNPNFKEF